MAQPALLATMRTDHLARSLPAHRRGTLSGMDAAPELTRTYLQRVPRWWAGKGPAAKLQIGRKWTLQMADGAARAVPRLIHLRHARQTTPGFGGGIGLSR
ncbi:hypothetical protein LN562_21690, partial [Xanthomonas euvesicatoria pv. euvesicatoria]|nr:hypothetical protein [Xanthomonas euvesicatoria pv. euvesicatoria]MCC8543809.1 hypothetical protein [Xanthomonas euvesicatoria pv. euvesicatoria]